MSTQKILITENKALHPHIQQDTNNNALTNEDEWLRICLSTPRAVILTDEAYKINFTLPVKLIIWRPMDAESPVVFLLIVEPWLAQRRKTGL